MIGRQRDSYHGPRADGTVNDPWPRHDFAEADNRHLWWIDDSVKRFDPAFPKARDRDRRVGNLRAADAAGPRALHKVAHLAHQRVERQLIGIVQRRRRQPAAANGNRDANMHRRRWFEFIVAIEPVKSRIAAYGQSDRLDGERADQKAIVR